MVEGVGVGVGVGEGVGVGVGEGEANDSMEAQSATGVSEHEEQFVGTLSVALQ